MLLPCRRSLRLTEDDPGVGGIVFKIVPAETVHENQQIILIPLIVKLLRLPPFQIPLLQHFIFTASVVPGTHLPPFVPLLIGARTAHKRNRIHADVLPCAFIHNPLADLLQQGIILLAGVPVVVNGENEQLHDIEIIRVSGIIFLCQRETFGAVPFVPLFEGFDILLLRYFVVPDQLIHRDPEKIGNPRQESDIGIPSPLPVGDCLGRHAEGRRQLLLGHVFPPPFSENHLGDFQVSHIVFSL